MCTRLQMPQQLSHQSRNLPPTSPAYEVPLGEEAYLPGISGLGGSVNQDYPPEKDTGVAHHQLGDGGTSQIRAIRTGISCICLPGFAHLSDEADGRWYWPPRALEGLGQDNGCAAARSCVRGELAFIPRCVGTVRAPYGQRH